ncbi:MAG: hypothetical protein ACXABG_14885, partial [Promethearchaeota archaeon]
MQENFTDIVTKTKSHLSWENNQKKKEIITFNCNRSECSELSGDIRKDPQCFSHLIDTIYPKDHKNIHQLIFEKTGNKIIFDEINIGELRELSIVIRKSRKDIQHISEILNQILKKERVILSGETQKSPTQLLNQNPFQLYTWLKAVKRGIVHNKPSHYNLKSREYRHTIRTINRIIKTLQLSTLIKKYDTLDNRIKKGNQQSILSLLLTPKVISIQLSDPSHISKDNLTILEKYTTTPFAVTIYTGDDIQLEPLYVYSSLMDNEPYKTICENTIRLLTDVSGSSLPKQTYLPIRKIIKIHEERAQRIIKSKIPEIAENILNKTARLSALSASGFGKIMPFLIDPHVNEFYVD